MIVSPEPTFSPGSLAVFANNVRLSSVDASCQTRFQGFVVRDDLNLLRRYDAW